MFGLDKVLDSVVSDATGGAAGEKTRAKTHLKTDKLLTSLTIMLPLVLLIFTRFFTPNTFKAASVLCSEGQSSYRDGNETIITSSKNNNRFYFNTFCWENLRHYPIDSTKAKYPVFLSKVENIISEETAVDLSIQKYYPYVMFTIIITLSLPMIWWTYMAATVIQPKVNFLRSGIQEALAMTMKILIDLESSGELYKDTSEEKKLSDGTVQTKMRRVLKDSSAMKRSFGEKLQQQKDVRAKFESFNDFIHSQCTRQNLKYRLICYRVLNLTILIMVSLFLNFICANARTQFNCKVPFSVIGEEDVVSEIISCGLSGVNIRIVITVIWIIGNILLLIAGIVGSVKEWKDLRSSTYLLHMIKPVTKHRVFLSNAGYVTKTRAKIDGFKTKGDHVVNSRMTDLSILLMMCDTNLENSPLIGLCLQARRLLKMRGYPPNPDKDHEKFLEAIVSIIIWHVPEKYDDDVERILANHYFSVEGTKMKK